MLDFLLLILFTFVSLCPYNAASTKYPYPVSAFFQKNVCRPWKALYKREKQRKKPLQKNKKKACPEEKSRGARPSVITRTCNQPQVLYQ